MLELIKSLFGGEKNYENLPDEAFQERLKNTSKSMIIDVRSKHEFDSEKIPNAYNLDVMHPNFKDKIKNFDPEKTYFVYCQSGMRSRRACNTFTKQGFQKVINLKKGINGYSGKTV